ncbi:hypothetical protein OPT61_g6498 [Boeremia exigua]|uniref:Uncharacterized protein n=1 Tax=Boeremia exigua TaxID=749465 RepID=A0ACC2I6E1_9PLEO|nr:hypothetical protein OPT61_g6498 [Boeremia exigua]
MAQPGVRLLSLDGCGTRGLVTLAILRELMDRVDPEGGGNCRPSQYFDIIAGTGLTGLCALLFVRFNYTIDGAIEFARGLSTRLDNVVDLRNRIIQDRLDEDVEWWMRCMEEYKDPKDQIEALRQGIVQDCWSAIIESNVIDSVERSMYMTAGDFDSKLVSGQVEVGRSKAFVVGSESKGWDMDGGISEEHQYHVPILHRTYQCRHGKSTYMLYAVGLGTVASPGVLKPGVILPDFFATGSHTVHNPINLVLDESKNLWPGLQISALISIGTGNFDIVENTLHPFVEEAGKVCKTIAKKNREEADRIERYVLPFDSTMSSAYLRFDNDNFGPFVESAQICRIAEEAKKWMGAPKQATKSSIMSQTISSSRYPNSPEDFIALSSLASLLSSLSVSGYTSESSWISDVIANYILYESFPSGDGSYRKLCMAATAEGLSSAIAHQHRVYADPSAHLEELKTEAAFLNNFVAFGDHASEEDSHSGQLHTIFDCTSAVYYCLVIAREMDRSKLQAPMFSKYLEQLRTHIELPPNDNPKLVEHLENALWISSISALCMAATTQFLCGVKALAYNGDFIRQIGSLFSNLSFSRVSNMIVDPISSVLALLLEDLGSCKLYDTILIALLGMGVEGGSQWSFVNLALIRCEVAQREPSSSLQDETALGSCVKLLHSQAAVWRSARHTLITRCVQNGWLSLIRKIIRSQELVSMKFMEKGTDFDHHVEQAFKSAAKAGQTYMMKSMAEGVGLGHWKRVVNLGDEQGLTAVHLACRNRAPKEVFHLLDLFGGDVNARCHAGRTPLAYCFPDQASLPSLHEDLLDLIFNYQLPTTVSHMKPEVRHGNGSIATVDSRAYDFRIIISHLLSRHADIVTLDNEGMTPLHRAAREGWGNNLDVLFMHYHEESDSQQRESLTIRDYNNRTVLDYARMAGERGDIQGKQDTVIAKMKILQIPIPPESNQTKALLSDAWLTLPIGRRRLTPEPTTERFRSTTPNTMTRPSEVTVFPAPYIYHDPSPPNERFSLESTLASGSSQSQVDSNSGPAMSPASHANAVHNADSPLHFSQPYIYSDPLFPPEGSINSDRGSPPITQNFLSEEPGKSANSRTSRLFQKLKYRR